MKCFVLTLSTFLWLVVSCPAPACKAALVDVSVVPQRSLVDQVVQTTVRAPAQSLVVVRFTTQRFGLTFESQATFKVPDSGVLRLSEQAPVSGSYQGKDPMGLFWSALPNGSPPKPFHFGRGSDLAPRPFTISAAVGSDVASTDGLRLVLAPSTSRQVADAPGFVATLFRSNGPRCHPGVIVLGGSEGGVPEEQAAVLASHGLTTLALAYYGVPGLPKSLTNVPVETVGQALTFMRKQPSVCPRQVALLGGSKGAELALLAATKFAGVAAVVALKPSSVVFSGLFGDPSAPPSSSWSYRGLPLPFANGVVPGAVQDAISSKENAHQRVAYVDSYLARVQNNTDPGAIIPVETIKAPVLLVAGASDNLWPSEYMARQIMHRRSLAPRRFADQLLVYPQAGHLIGIPFEFAKAELAHSGLDVGGSAEGDEAADEQAWPIIVKFLQRLGGQPPLPSAPRAG